MKLNLMMSIALFAIINTGLCQTTKLTDKAQQQAAQVLPKVINWRHDIHQHPELSNREFETSAKIAQHLRDLGMEVQTGVLKLLNLQA